MELLIDDVKCCIYNWQIKKICLSWCNDGNYNLLIQVIGSLSVDRIPPSSTKISGCSAPNTFQVFNVEATPWSVLIMIILCVIVSLLTRYVWWLHMTSRHLYFRLLKTQLGYLLVALIYYHTKWTATQRRFNMVKLPKNGYNYDYY